jgi:biotin transport system ATP-binding protein
MSGGIKLQSVTVEFDGHSALSEVTLELISKSIAVIGTNGSGKSTFARLLNGLVKATYGTVALNGALPSNSSAGFVFSNPDLQIIMPTVLEDVEFSLSNEKISKEEKRARALAALTFVGIEELQESNCHTLSSGQKQLLAIASTIVRKPDLLIADEPTTLLDLPNTKRITKLLHEIDVHQMVIVTHDLTLASTCEEVVWFNEGKVKRVGKPKTVIAAYQKHFG